MLLEKMKEVSEVVGKSVDSMISDGKLDIPKELINETIKERVNEKVDCEIQRKVKATCDNIVVDVKTSMYNKISDAAERAVDSTYRSMEVEAKEKIRKELPFMKHWKNSGNSVSYHSMCRGISGVVAILN